MSLDELYTHLRTYDVEIEQTNVKHKSKTVDNKNKTIQQPACPVAKECVISEEKDEGPLTTEAPTGGSYLTENEEATDDVDYYTLNKLEQLEDLSMFKMASMCSQLKFRKKSEDNLKSSGRTRSNHEDKKSIESVSSECCEVQLVERSTLEKCESEEVGHSSSDTEEST